MGGFSVAVTAPLVTVTFTVTSMGVGAGRRRQLFHENVAGRGRGRHLFAVEVDRHRPVGEGRAAQDERLVSKIGGEMMARVVGSTTLIWA
jgi:hypothetical protein